MARPRRGDSLFLTIDDLAFGGEGVGRADGYVIFVPGGVPGDPGASRRAARRGGTGPAPGRGRRGPGEGAGRRRAARGGPVRLGPRRRALPAAVERDEHAPG